MATGAPRSWSPAPLLKASAALHVGAVALALARPQLWPWALGAVVVNHLQLAATGLWPRSTLLGPNWTRLPPAAQRRGEVALSIDDGPEPAVTPKVLALLDEYGAKATFFCVGRHVEERAELAREIVRRGHAIENHSYRHLNYFSLLGPRALAYEIERAQEVIGSVTGERPRFFAHPPGCAVRCSIRSSRAWVFCSRVGRGAGSTPSTVTPTTSFNALRGDLRPATSCCSMMDMPHARERASP